MYLFHYTQIQYVPGAGTNTRLGWRVTREHPVAAVLRWNGREEAGADPPRRFPWVTVLQGFQEVDEAELAAAGVPDPFDIDVTSPTVYTPG